MKNQNHKGTVLVFSCVLIDLFTVFFGILIALIYLQNNRPEVFARAETPLIIGLVADIAVMLAVIFIFGKKALAAEAMLKREKIKKQSEPFIQSLRPRISYESLLSYIREDMERDGFLFTDSVNLHPEAKVILGYKTKFSLAYDHVGEFVFLMRSDENIAGEIDLAKAAQIMESVSKKRLLTNQSDLVIFCLFTESVSPELAKDVQEFFSEQLFFLLAVYELQSGKVFFLNTKNAGFGRFARIQGLVRRYIVGEKSPAGEPPTTLPL